MNKKMLVPLLRLLYSVCFYLALPIVYLRLLWRSRRLPAYRHRWRQRLAYFDFPSHLPAAIWLHAVSFGESIVAEPLIKALHHRYPNRPIVVTTTTPTGSQCIQDRFKHDVFHVYAPYDLPFSVKKFLNKVKPCLAIFIETELWPNYLHYLHQAGVPVMIANARLSARSARTYARLGGVMQTMLQQINMVAAQSPNDQRRFIDLGMPAEHVIMAGNIKFDLKVPDDIAEKSEQLLHQLGSNRKIWIAASTCAGEEAIILDAFADVKKNVADSLLLLVPRHPDRFDEVITLCQQQGLNVALRQPQQPCSAKTDVFIGNTMGELLLFYAVSQVAFVGGSLVNKGGHNMLEAAAFSLPIISGNSVDNFDYVASVLQQANALTFVDDASSLATVVSHLLQDVTLRKEQGQQALAVLDQHRGAVVRQLAIIEQLLTVEK